MDDLQIEDLEATILGIQQDDDSRQKSNGTHPCDKRGHIKHGADFTSGFSQLPMVAQTVEYFKNIFAPSKPKITSHREDIFSVIPGNIIKEITRNGKVSLTPFHTALVKGDMIFVKSVLDQLDLNERTLAVNSLVDYSQPTAFQAAIVTEKLQHCPPKHVETIRRKFETGPICKHPFPHLQQAIPLSLAAISGDFSMVKVLLQNNADVHQKDDFGNNCIHNLVLLAKSNTKLAVEIYKKLTDHIVFLEDKNKLILAKNLKHQQPLDLCFREACWEFSLTLLNTNGVYRFPIKDYGTLQHVLYDVTEYESMKKHRELHIFSYLSLSRERDLKVLNTLDFMEREPIKTWMKVKNESMKYFIWSWCFAWILFISLYLTILGIYFLNNGSRPPTALSATLLVISSVLLVVEIITFVSEIKLYKLMSWSDWPIAFSPTYRIFHAYFVTTLIITESLHLADIPCDQNQTLFVTLYVLNAVFGLSSLLIFTQLNQYTGHLLIVIDRMIDQMFLFVGVAGIIYLSFATSFYMLHAPPVCHDNNNELDWNRTTLMFSSFYNALYETQLLSVGSMAPLALYFEEAHIPLLGMFLYVSLLMMLMIVLLNLLIAIMSDRVAELDQHKTIITHIQRLALTMYVDNKMKFYQIFGYNRFSFVARLKLKTDNQYYLTNESTGQKFLHVIESKLEQGCRDTRDMNREVTRVSRISTATLRSN